jgi:hypothetical protein
MKTPSLTGLSEAASHESVNSESIALSDCFYERMSASANGGKASPRLIDFPIVTEQNSSFPSLNERA